MKKRIYTYGIYNSPKLSENNARKQAYICSSQISGFSTAKTRVFQSFLEAEQRKSVYILTEFEKTRIKQ